MPMMSAVRRPHVPDSRGVPCSTFTASGVRSGCEDSERTSPAEDQVLRLPLVKVAFDDPATRAAWTAARRQVVFELCLWSTLFVAAFAVTAVLAPAHSSVEFHSRGRGDNSLSGVIGGLAFLAYPFALYSCCGALSRLRMARSILEVYPWQSLAAVCKLSGTGEALGVSVRSGSPTGPRRTTARARTRTTTARSGQRACPPAIRCVGTDGTRRWNGAPGTRGTSRSAVSSRCPAGAG